MQLHTELDRCMHDSRHGNGERMGPAIAAAMNQTEQRAMVQTFHDASVEMYTDSGVADPVGESQTNHT
jgi:hypothetical protein